MLQLSETVMTELAVHFVGNQNQGGKIELSDALFEPSPEVEIALIQYFLKPFGKAEVSYKLHTPEAGEKLEDNPIFAACQSIFADADTLFDQSVKLANHLFAQSQHPHIKPGEFFIAKLSDAVLEGELVDAVGIFKAERKESFLRFGAQPTQLSLLEGINVGKLDKGVLIFNTEAQNGYRVAVVDANNYDTHYWNDDFLTLRIDQNESFQTKAVMDLCQDFVKESPELQEDKAEQMVFLSKSVDYLKNHDNFEMEEFAKEVLPQPEAAEELLHFKKSYEANHEVELRDDFEIAQPAVKTLKKQVKSSINLDTNIQIKLDFDQAESARQFLEKGYDQEKNMYYYKVYFNQEMG
ncbi:MAG: nucleoid-associated protein [Salibacteraceae bacterium]